MPDVIVKRFFRHELSIEATRLGSPETDLADFCSEFHRWIYRQVQQSDISINGASISTDATPTFAGESGVPKKHLWPRLKKHPSWATFLDELRLHGRAAWECPEGGISTSFEVRQNGYVTGNLYSPDIDLKINKHPIYRCIQAKAKQASSKWPTRIKNRPIVLAICTPSSGREFLDWPAQNDFSPDRAIWLALLDHDKLTDLERVNILHQKLNLSPEGIVVDSKRLRVAGSRLISAVLWVRIQQVHDSMKDPPTSQAITNLYVNPHAGNPLSTKFQKAIERMDFNIVVYGPGWESWHGSPSEPIKERSMLRGGTLEFRAGKEGEFEMRIPTIQVLKILSGEKTAQEVFSEYGGPPSPIQKFQDALESKSSLESVSIAYADPASRAEQQIIFRFAPGAHPVVARTKNVD